MSDTSLSPDSTPLPEEFLNWQIELRHYTMSERKGSPHVGVAPLLTVTRPGRTPAATTHSIICGLLPAPELLGAKTAEFRSLYEESVAEGDRVTYDRGIEYLEHYYSDPEGFDRRSISTILATDSPAVAALRDEPRCSLIFYVFDLMNQSEIEKFRCLQLDCRAEIHTSGPVFENVWWHNRLFHGRAEDSVVIQFHHRRTFDTRFGSLTRVS
jgi:hypothetical protein